MGSIGFSEVLVVLVLALVVFGPRRLPEIARQIGSALGELRRVSGQFQDELKNSLGLEDNFPYMSGSRPALDRAPPSPASTPVETKALDEPPARPEAVEEQPAPPNGSAPGTPTESPQAAPPEPPRPAD